MLTSLASPSRIAPFGASAKTLARVVPLGLTTNKTLADAAAASYAFLTASGFTLF